MKRVLMIVSILQRQEMMTEPIVSKKFDVEDIRKIREYNSLRHIKMTSEEIIADTKRGAKRIMELLQKE